MNHVSITDKWKYNDLKTIIIENDLLKVVVIPEVGGKIENIIYKPQNIDFLWHNTRLETRKPPFAANIDDYWSGGIDIVFPTFQPCDYKGEQVPFFGELWALPWEYELIQNRKEVGIHMWRKTVITPFLFESWILLDNSDSKKNNRIKVKYKVTNLINDRSYFIFGTHFGLTCSDKHRIDIPAKKLIFDDFVDGGNLAEKGKDYKYPYLYNSKGEKFDVRFVPPVEKNTYESVYAVDLEEGFFALTDQEKEIGFGYIFPEKSFKGITMWLGYGGWRGHYFVLLEPWINVPTNLELSHDQGKAIELGPKEFFDIDSEMVIYSSKKEIKTKKDFFN